MQLETGLSNHVPVWPWSEDLMLAGIVCKVHVEMEDNAIPEEYFTCHGDMLFDLLASALVDFAKRHGRCAVDLSLAP